MWEALRARLAAYLAEQGIAGVAIERAPEPPQLHPKSGKFQLHHAGHEPIYGVAMIAELAHHGYDLSSGTLYPLLHSLEEQGYLIHTDRVVEGRVRKYYVITEEGRAALLEAKQKIAELVHEVLEEEDDTSLPELPPSVYDEETEEA